MIEGLRGDELIDKFGGRFKLAVLIQRRWRQLLQGARPMVETEGLTEMEVVVQEILEGKIDMELVDDDNLETADDEDVGL
ncbi:MAG: DNA-directed RNA polymerase subunit omega [Phycisphaerae bacterium]